MRSLIPFPTARAARRAAPVACAAAVALTARNAAAEDALSAGDTAWMMTSTALVLLMTLPGLALFYGGLVRSKNVLSILMQCLIAAGLLGVVWVLVGYSLAFGEGNAFVGDLSKVLLSHADPDTLAGSIPEYVFVMFQGMFAIITPALMIGAFAERMRFGPYLAFITVWLLLVYCPLAHMVWGGGFIGAGGLFMGGHGALDFAGGLVVHMSSGFSALVAALFLGPRVGHGKQPMPPHSMPLVVIGAALLWVGWFGFNAGSELAADGTAGLAFITTSTATSTAVLTWVAIEWLHNGKPTVLGAATAAVAGLVSITPACAFVSPGGSLLVGAGGAAICYVFVMIVKPAVGYDDSLDVFGVHGIGGAWGALATGLFIAGFALPEDVSRGAQVFTQVKSILFTAVFAPLLTIVILLVLRALFGSLRPTPENEGIGLDQSEHNESAYIETA